MDELEVLEPANRKGRKSEKFLPTIEVGSFLWTPGWADNIRFNIVVKRTWIVEEQGSLFGEGHWDYCGIVVALPQLKFTFQETVEFHNKRGNCGNFLI